MQDVTPLKSLVSWVGGKRRLAPEICRRIDAVPHDLYVEVFMGMGSVFLARRRRPKVEVINDASLDVVTLFRVAKHHPAALVDELRLSLVSRAEFQRLLATPPDTLTDIQRAARFFVLQRMRYGGKPTSGSFPARGNASKGLSLDRLLTHLTAVRDRLSSVVIERMDWSELLCRYDRPGALFYLDPPYWGCEDYYGEGMFGRADHARLADALLGLKGRFVLSINDVPEIRTVRRQSQGRGDLDRVHHRRRSGSKAGDGATHQEASITPHAAPSLGSAGRGRRVSNRVPICLKSSAGL
ncbi:DNA adenine methylase, partial [Pararhodospirillum oryzae]|uniref:DNA adenine methylase n=1 Tax=Pararhodospirillum oryzae TaxID=478448 RepID=UPI001FE5DABB